MKTGERYRHYKGRVYSIIEPNAFDESNLNPVVVYKSEDTNEVWVRSKVSFEQVVRGSFLPEGTKRFTKLENHV